MGGWSGVPCRGRAKARRGFAAGVALVCALTSMPPAVRAAEPSQKGYADLSLEELATVLITTVSRRPQAIAGAPAAVFVITGDDLRRSGASTLAEGLRLAPMLQVAQLNARDHAISTRGFGSVIANKLLVMIDGRTVYSPLFSGVFWDAQDLILEDIEQIEVVSGAGGATWGTNAVNGVINILTRKAGDTQGVLAKVGAGSEDRTLVARYGFAPGERSHMRIYAKALERSDTQLVGGGSAEDGWRRSQAGFRGDWASGADVYTLQGDAYHGKSETRPIFGAVTLSGANLLARWSRRVDDSTDFDLQTYYDRTERVDNFLLQERAQLFDLEAKGRHVAGVHRWLVGGNYRHGRDAFDPGVYFAFVPPRVSQSWYSLFAQDELRVASNLQLTLGLRFEHNPYTAWESLPSARLGWSATPQDLFWTSVSRAVRSPARLDREIVFPTAPPYVIAGGPQFRSELATTVELGYRGQPSGRFSWAATAFVTDYRRLRSAQLDAQGVITIENGIEGRVHGLQADAQWQVDRDWRLRGGFALLNKHLGLVAGSNDPTGPSNLGDDPRAQWSLRSSHRIGERVEVEGAVRHVGSLPQPAVASYTALDLRIGWRVANGVDLSLTGRNLFDPGHVEYRQDPYTSEIPRSIVLGLRWQTR
jgi:iron complex outermembrane receptor protein